MKRTRYTGFTLVEVLVALAIISLLTGVIFNALSGSREAGRDSKRVSDLEQISVALRLYAEQNDDYPAGSGELGVGGAIDTALAPYLPDVPQDPRNDGTTYYYYYGRAVTCNGTDRVVVYARTMETGEHTNGPSTGCAAPANEPTARTLVIAQTPS